MGRARGGQPRLRPRPRPPRLGARDRWPAAAARPAGTAAGPGQPGASGVPARAARRAAHRVPHRLPQVGHQPRHRRRRAAPGGEPGVHRQTEALYALLDELRRRHPASRSRPAPAAAAASTSASSSAPTGSGPATATTPLERQQIQRWTALLVPPELSGAHVGAAHAHTTGPHAYPGLPRRHGAVRPLRHGARPHGDGRRSERRSRNGSRCTSASERWCTPGGWCAADHPDPALWVHGVVAQDGERGALRPRGAADPGDPAAGLGSGCRGWTPPAPTGCDCSSRRAAARPRERPHRGSRPPSPRGPGWSFPGGSSPPPGSRPRSCGRSRCCFST